MGDHRRHRGPESGPGPRDYDVLEAADGTTIDGLRAFIAAADAAAGDAAGQLQIRVAVRHAGDIKTVWVRIPRR
jgi:hypothetical protein